MILKPVTSEKAVKRIDLDNTLTFEVNRRERKEDISKEVETMFKVKVTKIRTLTMANRKVAFVKLDKNNPAIDVATKLGLI